MKMISPALFLVALAVGASTASVAVGAVLSFDALLTGSAESPPNASPGTGTALVDFDTTANTMHVHIDFTGL
jgi:hypothetical protein